jgi:D-alanyl-D-alanine dipeptidase
VADLLAAVDRQLRFWGYALFLKDAYRPLAVQTHIFQRAQARLKKNGLGAEEQGRRLAEWIAFPSDNSDSPPPHLTGGAVDVVLWSLGKCCECEMGKNGTESGNAYPDALERKSQLVALSPTEEEGQVNRRILFWLMTHFGFAPNPTEYWHFSWGDQMWAKLTGQPAAHYGPASF